MREDRSIVINDPTSLIHSTHITHTYTHWAKRKHTQTQFHVSVRRSISIYPCTRIIGMYTFGYWIMPHIDASATFILIFGIRALPQILVICLLFLSPAATATAAAAAAASCLNRLTWQKCSLPNHFATQMGWRNDLPILKSCKWNTRRVI